MSEAATIEPPTTEKPAVDQPAAAEQQLVTSTPRPNPGRRPPWWAIYTIASLRRLNRFVPQRASSQVRFKRQISLTRLRTGLVVQQLWQRYVAGEGVTLQEVFDAAGLSPAERDVLTMRLAGMTFLEVARVRAASGHGGSKSQTRRIEYSAFARLGLSETISTTITGPLREEFRREMVARRKLITYPRGDPLPARSRVRYRTSEQLDRLAKLLIKSAGTPAEENIRAEIQRISQCHVA
jgi:hypothetical protein